jgi:hypothetical protein
MLCLFASLYNLQTFKLYISSALISLLVLFPYSVLYILQATSVQSFHPAVLRTSRSQTCTDVVVLPLLKNLEQCFLIKCFKHALSFSINNQHYALDYITSLFNIQAPTCFGSSLPSSWRFLDPCELLEKQNI